MDDNSVVPRALSEKGELSSPFPRTDVCFLTLKQLRNLAGGGHSEAMHMKRFGDTLFTTRAILTVHNPPTHNTPP